jgi:hypothetical protein
MTSQRARRRVPRRALLILHAGFVVLEALALFAGGSLAGALFIVIFVAWLCGLAVLGRRASARSD